MSQRRGRPLLLLIASFAVLLAGAAPWRLPTALAQTPAGVPVRLPGHVLPALAQATQLHASAHAAAAVDQPLTLTVVLNRSDEAGFQKFLTEIENPLSPNFRHFLSQDELTKRFGPSQQAYDAVLTYLQTQGFTLIEGSANRLTLTLKGTRSQAEQAFAVSLGDYQLQGRSFFANDLNPAVPASIAPFTEAIVGLSNLAQPQRPGASGQIIDQLKKVCTGDTGLGAVGIAACIKFLTELAASAAALAALCAPALLFCVAITGQIVLAAIVVGLIAAAVSQLYPGPKSEAGSRAATPAAAPVQKLGLLEFDTFHPQDVANWLTANGVPPLRAGELSQVHVNGGVSVPGPGEAEVLLDVDSVVAIAPTASVVVYDAPDRTSFQTIFNTMIGDGDTVISNSWTDCENQHSQADVQSLDAILANGAASGVSVFNGTGDTGSTCLGFAPGTIGVPSDSPHATAVGGSTLRQGSGFAYGGESWWDGSSHTPQTGQGGFGTSRFFSRPAYQDGVSGSPMRSVPDVVALADPAEGLTLCQADAGGCPDGLLHGGTSLAAPEWAALTANLNQLQGRNLGLLNPQLYPLATTTAFHSAASLGSDFAHVGLGSANFDALNLALAGRTAGPASAAISSVLALPGRGEALTFPVTAPADGTTTATIQVNLLDANGHSVSGKQVSLAANAGSHAVISPGSGASSPDGGAVAFTVTGSTIEQATFTATDTTDNLPIQQTATISFVSPPATDAGIAASPATVPADGATASTITVTLKNAQGQGASGKTINLSQGSGHSTITGSTPSSGVTDANGMLKFTVVDSITESVTYTATDVTDGNLPVPGSATVSFTNGQANSCSNGTPTAASGYAFTDFATGFPTPNPADGCGAPVGLAFDAGGNLYATDFFNSTLYKFGPRGGVAGPATIVAQIPSGTNGVVAGLAFGKDGRLYAAQIGGFEGGNGQVVELDPASGAIKRVVAPYNGFGSTDCALGLATDPLSGDLFFSEPRCTFLGGEGYINRIANPAGASPTLSHYATPSITDGLTFGPDGTLYASTEQRGIVKLSGTNMAMPPTITTIATVPKADGVALGVNPSNPGQPPAVFVNRNDGKITKLDLSTDPPVMTDIYSGGSRGDFVAVGPDGCLYATQTDRVIRVSNADGTCPFAVTSALPQITLAPAAVSPNPATGTPLTFTATLRNVTNPAGTVVTFSVSGANLQVKLVAAAADGTASFTYTGAVAGVDTVTATATAGSQSLTSNPTTVTWTAGKHATFLNVNLSAKTGGVNTAVMLQANLTDISVTPQAAIGGAAVSISVGSQSCTATTDGSGNASCQISLSSSLAAGSYPLVASYAGDAQRVASDAKDSFTITTGSIPTVGNLAPASGSPRGGTTLTITGSVVKTGATVTIGGQAANGVLLNGDGTITAKTPARPPVGDVTGDGAVTAVDALCILRSVAQLAPTPACPASGLTTTVPVTVSNPNGGSAVVPGGFTYLNGDVNGDGLVTPVDALCVLRSVAALPATPACPALSTAIAGDVNADGLIDAVDALCVLRYTAGLPVSNGCPLRPSSPTDPIWDVHLGGGPISAIDALCILRRAAGLGGNATCLTLSGGA